MPSYLAVLGWESLSDRNGVLAHWGLDPLPLRHLVFGPIGIIWILATKGMPFAYLATVNALAAVGREFEDAARVHGASPLAAARLTIPIIAPALWATLAMVFAESISDFGVASTLAPGAHFPLATFTLYQAIDTMPIDFPVASAIGWFLVFSVVTALFVQYRSLHGRSYAVLSRRARPNQPRTCSMSVHILMIIAIVSFFLLALGVPLFGAIIASLLKGFGGVLAPDQFTLSNYQQAMTAPSLQAPLRLSTQLAAICATFAIVLGLIAGQTLSRKHSSMLTRFIDLILLTAVALPGIVLGAGFIFAYNLPILAHFGIALYGTLPLLAMAYLGGALPSTTRLLSGSLAQVQENLLNAVHIHGGNTFHAVVDVLIPIIIRSLIWAWLFAFSGILLELPLSELLYPPGSLPLAVAIIKKLNRYDYATGSAMMITAVLSVLVLIAITQLLFRLLAPKGWQKIGHR